VNGKSPGGRVVWSVQHAAGRGRAAANLDQIGGQVSMTRQIVGPGIVIVNRLERELVGGPEIIVPTLAT